MKQITARDVWKTLERRYTSLSRTHVLSFKAELDRVHKNNDTMMIYLDRVKEIRDKLNSVGVEIDDEERLHIVLKGLPPKYDAFCSAMRTRDKFLSCEDLHVLLTSEEESKKNAKSIAHELQHMAMAATGFKGPPTTNTPLPLFSGSWNKGRGGHSPNYRGRGRGGLNLLRVVILISIVLGMDFHKLHLVFLRLTLLNLNVFNVRFVSS